MAVKGVQSLATGLRVLELVAIHQPAGAAELARITGLHKSVVHRALVTLHEQDWIAPVGAAPALRWVLTGRALAVGSAFAASRTPREAAHQLLRHVAAETGETVLLSVHDGRRLLVVDLVESPQPLKVAFPVGATLDVDVDTAAGRALVAGLADDELDRLFDAGARERMRAIRPEYERLGYALQTDPATPLWAAAVRLRRMPDMVDSVVVAAVPQPRSDLATVERLGVTLRDAVRRFGL
ncbi:IclR family transcriptional regulator [Streptomyces spiralis]|uniref:IclR family transcriptional regulator n=1 Tax=Streptomyces spiralis TaxID=66376 RepID=UPI003401BC2F